MNNTPYRADTIIEELEDKIKLYQTKFALSCLYRDCLKDDVAWAWKQLQREQQRTEKAEGQTWLTSMGSAGLAIGVAIYSLIYIF